MAAAITIIPTRWCAAAIASCRSTSMCRAVRRPQRRCSTACCCCKRRSAALRRSNAEHGRDARYARQDHYRGACRVGNRLCGRLWRIDRDRAGVRHRRGDALSARRWPLPILESDRHHRGRLAGPRAALRRGLSPVVAETERAHPRQGRDRRDDAGALDHRGVCRRRLVRARDLRSLRHRVHRPPGHAAHPDRLRFRGSSAAQGFSAHRLCRGPLRRRAQARGLRAGAAGAGIPHVRFSVALGRHRLRAARRREGEEGASVMKPTLKPGMTHRFSYKVPENKTVPYTYPESPEIAAMPKVFATGYMIVLMEWVCTQLLAPHLDSGEGSLGVHVDVSHLAATLPGMTVTVDVECSEVVGQRVSFKVKAHDGIDLIGEGRHERFVVMWDKFNARVATKAAKVAQVA